MDELRSEDGTGEQADEPNFEKEHTDVEPNTRENDGSGEIIKRMKSHAVQTTPEDYEYTLECLREFHMTPELPVTRPCNLRTLLKQSQKLVQSDEILYRTAGIRLWLRKLVIQCLDRLVDHSHDEYSYPIMEHERISDARRYATGTILAIVDKIISSKMDNKYQRCSFIILILSGNVPAGLL